MNYQFPVDTCVVACSGPSLNKVDVFSLGLPVCAISTAIRTIKEPNYWFIADHLNEMHGQEGKDAWINPNIVKVVPNKTPKSPGMNIVQQAYREGREANRQYETLLFKPNEPLLRGPHKTLTFAIQWLHISGVKKIIFAGNDLIAESFETKYSYPLEQFDRKKQHNFKKTLDQIKDYLRIWYPVAKAKGFEWYSWNCGSEFEAIVPSYNDELLQNIQQHSNPGPIVIDTSFEEVQKEKQENQKKVEDLKEYARSRFEYRKLLREQDQKPKAKRQENLKLYFDMVHKRSKK